MKKVILLLTLLAICSLIVFSGGFIAVDRSRYHNDFIRLVPPHAADICDTIRVKPEINFDSLYHDHPEITAVQHISSNSAILRKIDINKRENVLLKSRGGQRYVLKKQIDGLLCTDGYLQYSKQHYQLVYTYRYRNQFICLDTNLNVVRISKTIDTTSVAKISVAETGGKITMSKPPLVVNKGTCVDGKYLFVRSNLAAKNESPAEFKNRSVIDVYNILDGSYRFSFYIENHDSKRLQNFKVNGTVLVATFSDAMVQYDLPSQYLP
jgi:hypothetical protein